jgi:hypothetical protein
MGAKGGQGGFAVARFENHSIPPTAPALLHPTLVCHRVAQTGQGILTNMFEHVDAQRIVRVCEEAWPVEQRREPRRGGGLGIAFFWLLLAPA